MAEPLTIDIIYQLMFISFGLVLFSLLLNKILGVKPSKMKEIRDKAKNLRERVRQAEILGDTQLLQQLQVETMTLMKTMLKKQLVPMCIRCIIFIGIFIVMSMVYGQYEYWFWIYFLFSFSFSMAAFGLRYLYKRIMKKEDKRKQFSKEIMELIYPRSQIQTSGLSLTGHTDAEFQTPSTSEEEVDQSSEEQKLESSWKEKLQD
jgi:hypothetical protein